MTHRHYSLLFSKALLDVIPYGLLVTDGELGIIHVNRWLTERLGIDSLAVANCPLNEAFPELPERGLLGAYDVVRNTRQPLTLSARLNHYFLRMPPRNGSDLAEMPQVATIVPFFEGSHLTGLLTVIQDATDGVIAEHELLAEITKLSALHEIDRAMTMLDLQACLQIIVTRARALFNADSAALMMVEDSALRLVAADGVPGEVDKLSIPLGNGLTGWAAANRQPVVVPDVQLDSRYIAVDSATRAEMVAPLLMRDECIGVLNIESAVVNAFAPDSLELLQTFAARAAAAIYNARLYGEVRSANERLDILVRAARLLSAQLAARPLLDSVVSLVAEVFAADRVTFTRLDSAAGVFRIAADYGASDFARRELWLPAPTDPEAIAHFSHAHIIPDVREVALPGGNFAEVIAYEDLRSLLYVGVFIRKQLVGGINIYSVGKSRDFTQAERELLEALAAQVSLALENAELYAEQQQLAVTDGLTGLANRRQFDAELARELDRAARFGHVTSLIMLDIDNFKHYNDHYGHQAGDEMLKAIAAVMRRDVRAIDVPARYGGEEMAIILPETPPAAAFDAAERLRRQVAALYGASIPAPVTVSVGVATAPEHGDTPAMLIQSADAALYKAKHSGKNQVSLHRLQ